METKLKKYFKDSRWFAAIFTFIAGLMIHLFGLINVLHNHDNIHIQPTGYGWGIESGRWFLTVLGNFFNRIFLGFNLSWLCGVGFIFFIAVAVYFIVDIFHLKSRVFSTLLVLVCIIVLR